MSRHQQRYSAWTDIDFDRDGKQVGAIHVSLSSNTSAYRALRVPLIVIRNGEGPGCLVMGGNHGDEWEGQIVAAALAREIEPDAVRGTLIIMPHANLPACQAGTRLSPLDEGNLNLTWPGVEGGQPTSQIAHFIEQTILPRVSHWVDLHTGGKTLIYGPKPAIHLSDDKSLNRRAFEALRVFGAPENLVFEIQEARSASAAAQRNGVVYLYGEFGGGSLVSQEGLQIAGQGTRNLLAHLGIVPEVIVDRPPVSQKHFMMTGADYRATRALYWFAETAGAFEPRVAMGEAVTAGQVAGFVHALDGSLRPPLPVVAKAAGIVVCLRGQPLVENGDCLGHLAVEVPEDGLLARWTV